MALLYNTQTHSLMHTHSLTHRFQLEMERVRAEMAMLTSSTATTKEDLEAKLEAVSSRRAVLEEKLKDIRTQLDTYEQQLEQARQDAIVRPSHRSACGCVCMTVFMISILVFCRLLLCPKRTWRIG